MQVLAKHPGFSRSPGNVPVPFFKKVGDVEFLEFIFGLAEWRTYPTFLGRNPVGHPGQEILYL
ncbi:MAG: hypothetical protein A2Z51_01700 [Deltaproteobacteria bacterium RBG_19FT_COMBO_52_11]|nr:MAG: hypothetical protein A2Z51_01700 [Deltaproteobacteria bacterium RBG_19FT_COMBO_52_11]